MAEKGKNVPLSQVNTLEPGDLLFFNTTGKSFSHVGIYIGEGKFLHASSGKGQVITLKKGTVSSILIKKDDDTYHFEAENTACVVTKEELEFI